MHEQRPPTSPGVQSAGQPQRLATAQSNTPHAPRLNSVAHASPTVQSAPRPVIRPTAAQASTASLPLDEEDDDLVVLDDAIPLDDDASATTPRKTAAPSEPIAPTAPKKITFGAENTVRTHQWKRKPHLSGHGACRVRTFHGKCSDQGMEYLDDAINVFLDEHPDIEVKFVQSNVAMFDGKFKDFALIVNVWY